MESVSISKFYWLRKSSFPGLLETFASGSPLEIKTLECLLKTFNIRTVPVPEANLGPANLSVSFACSTRFFCCKSFRQISLVWKKFRLNPLYCR